MNSLKWRGDETLDDLPDYWIELVEQGNKAQLLRSISGTLNRGVIHVEDEYPGSEEMCILSLAYDEDARKVIEMVKSSEDHEVGENLR